MRAAEAVSRNGMGKEIKSYWGLRDYTLVDREKQPVAISGGCRRDRNITLFNSASLFPQLHLLDMFLRLPNLSPLMRFL